MTQLPRIEKVQHNIKGLGHTFGGTSFIDQEYADNINHDRPVARIVLENGNWIEYRMLDDDTMEECVFVQVQHPTGQYEAFLEDSSEIRAMNFDDAFDFFRAVDESIDVYRGLETVEDLERDWETIRPVVSG